jgi:hypothetical protein
MKTKEERILYNRNYKQTHKEEINAQRKIYRLNHKQERKEVRDIIRLKIIALLGGKCTNPYNLNHGDFINDIRCLCIDHINGGGCKEAKQYKGNREKYYRIILDKIESGSKDYQILCYNCNWIKRIINKEN